MLLFPSFSLALLWASLNHFAIELLHISNDYAWYLSSDAAKFWMAESGCIVPTISCIRLGKLTDHKILAEISEREKRKAENRLIEAERERRVKEQEAFELQEMRRKAKLFDELSEANFTINVNMINNNTFVNYGVINNNVVYVQSCSKAAPDKAVQEDMARREIDNPYFTYYNSSDIHLFDGLAQMRMDDIIAAILAVLLVAGGITIIYQGVCVIWILVDKMIKIYEYATRSVAVHDLTLVAVPNTRADGIMNAIQVADQNSFLVGVDFLEFEEDMEMAE